MHDIKDVKIASHPFIFYEKHMPLTKSQYSVATADVTFIDGTMYDILCIVVCLVVSFSLIIYAWKRYFIQLMTVALFGTFYRQNLLKNRTVASRPFG